MRSSRRPRHLAAASAPPTRRALWLVAATLGITTLASPVAASGLPESAFGAMRWRLVGPFRAGRALAAAGIPGDPSTFYFGSVGGGVWKTTNAGVTWEPIFDSQAIASIGALALAPSDPSVIYVGSGEADMRSDISLGNGVYRSDDGGKSWRHLGLDDTHQIGKILVDPRNPDVVLVAALGHAYGPNQARGVYRSTNAGRSWSKVLSKNADTGAVDLALDPDHPATVYASLWQSRRVPWSQYAPEEGPGSGLYRSEDGGETWSEVRGGGFPSGSLGRIGVAVARGGRVYALIGGKDVAGLYRSDDAGATWTRVNADANITTRSWYFGRVFVDPSSPDTVYCPNRGLMRSTDGGHTFTVLKGSPGGDDYHYLWIDPTNGRRMILASDQGTVVSLDGGATWSSWYNQPTAQFYHVATDHDFPYRLYGTEQDSGSVAIASRSDYGSITFRDWYSVGAGESGYIAPDPRNPALVYGGDVGGRVFRYDSTTHQTHNITPWPAFEFSKPVSEMKYRYTWTVPLVLDPLAPDTLYLGTQVILKTTDGGLHWAPVSPDLTGVDPQASKQGPVTVANARSRGFGVVFTVAPSPVQEGVIWAGTDTGLIQLTTDGGQHWQDVTPEGLPAWSKISLIEASPFDATSAYAAVDRHRLDDFAPYIYRTHDGGKHWERADQGLSAPAFVHVVRADPERKGLLYAGTELGPYVSFDDGDHWQPLQLNLPMTSIRDLAVEQGDLIAATHGRAFWILDDLTPLRQLASEVLAAPAHLFAPRAAIRVRRSEGSETPFPPELPHGTNPPAGAILDYLLKDAPTGPVTIEIHDAEGRLVRRLSSEQPLRSPAEPPYFMDAWLPRDARLTAHAGLNRVVWDLRYPPPPALRTSYSIEAIPGQGTVETPEGPLALPGRYEVRLSVHGTTLTQPLEVRMDPRVRVGEAALGAQLRLGLSIWNGIARQRALDTEASSLETSLAALGKKPLPAETTGVMKRLQARVGALRKALASSPLPGLEGVVGSADREPTSQAREVFAQAIQALDEQTSEWRALRVGDLAALNAALVREGGAAVQIAPVAPANIEIPAAAAASGSGAP